MPGVAREIIKKKLILRKDWFKKHIFKGKNVEFSAYVTPRVPNTHMGSL